MEAFGCHDVGFQEPVSWLRASRREQRWKRKTWSCGNRSMCFAGERQSDRTSTIRIVFYLFGSIAGFRPSLRWLRLSGRRPPSVHTPLRRCASLASIGASCIAPALVRRTAPEPKITFKMRSRFSVRSGQAFRPGSFATGGSCTRHVRSSFVSDRSCEAHGPACTIVGAVWVFFGLCGLLLSRLAQGHLGTESLAVRELVPFGA
jgi:hypothetical protein